MLCSAEEEGYTLLALLAPVLFCCFAVLPIFAIVYKLYGSRQPLGSMSTVCGMEVQWGGTVGEIERKETELNEALTTFTTQGRDFAGSEAGSMIRRAAEGRIKVIRSALYKLKRDEKLFDHTVFQER